MATTSRFGWRTPDGPNSPAVHVDMATLANDIEATVGKTRILVSGFPKDAGPAVVNGWVVSNMTVYKYQVGPDHYIYNFTGYLGRSSAITIAAGAGGEIIIPNILATDVNIDGGPNVTPGTYVPTVVQGGGSVFGGCQMMFVGRDIRIRSVSQCGLTASHNVVVNGYEAHSTK